MSPASILCRYSRFFKVSALVLGYAVTAHGADSYSAGALTLPSVVVGGQTYADMIVTLDQIVSGPMGLAPDGLQDAYDPSTGDLTVQEVTVGSLTYYNVVVTVDNLISVGSVTGGDIYNGTDLIIPSVQVQGGSVYANVVITVGSIVSTGGGMPIDVRDHYNPGNRQLTIAAIQLGGRVYTNAVVTVGRIVSVGAVGIPAVVGLTQAEATTVIDSVGMTVGTVTTASSATVPAGSVISQMPAPGGSVAPGTAVNLIVSIGPMYDVTTYHYDATRSGLNPAETALTPATVNSAGFGKVGEFPVDGRVDGAVLYVNQLAIPGTGTRNVIYFGTENDSVYAVDAGSIAGASATVLWKTSVLAPGESTVPLASIGCGNIDPVGVTSTPVIDRSRNALYVLSYSIDGSGNFYHRLHALSLTTGKELFGGPVTITATVAGSHGTATFQPRYQFSRAALLESGNTVYAAFGGFYGDCGIFAGWVLGYNADTLAQSAAIDLNPNSNLGGIWLSGGGPAADSAGNLYVPTGSSTDTVGPGTNGDYAESLVRLSGGGTLSVLDFFAPMNAVSLNGSALGLASSNSLLLPDLVDDNGVTRHLATAAGKDDVLYIVDRDNMGGWNAGFNNVYQRIALGSAMNYSSPAFFNNTLYIGPGSSPLQAYRVSQALVATSPTSQTENSFSSLGTVPSASSNGASDGIVWALDGPNAVLHAYNASNLATELYNSTQAGSRDQVAAVRGHFITPVVAKGRVYFGTGTTMAVFGLLNP